MNTKTTVLTLCAVLLGTFFLQAETKRPNILVITTDDVGIWNLGIYTHGMMGVPTPNIDRIGGEGMPLRISVFHDSQPLSTQ